MPPSNDGAAPDWAGTPAEAVVATVPFTIRRRVRWSDTDAAGVVYTARFFDYAIDAFRTFIGHLLEGPAQARKTALGIALPMKAASAVFHRSLRPDEDFLVVVRVAALRERTFEIQVAGRTLGGAPCFDVTLTPICVAPAERRAVPMPALLRARLAAAVTAPDGA